MALNGRISVIGLGSPIMTDDSIGLKISEAIERMEMDDVDCYQETVGGMEVLPLMRGYSYAVIVDAIQTLQYEPGTVLIFDITDFESTVNAGVPAHDINVATAVRIGRQIDPGNMPKKIMSVAMEIKDMETMGEDLTSEVAMRKSSMVDATMHVIGTFRQDRAQRSTD